MYILKNIENAVYEQLTVSNFTYFFMSKARKALYITEEEHKKKMLEKAEQERKRQLAIQRWREKKVMDNQRVSKSHIKGHNRPIVDLNMPDYSDSEYFKNKAREAEEMHKLFPFDSSDTDTPKSDNHSGEGKSGGGGAGSSWDHHIDHHNDHKASWGHDVGWNHSSNSTHTSHSHDSHSSHSSYDSGSYDSSSDSSSSCDSGTGDSGGD